MEYSTNDVPSLDDLFGADAADPVTKLNTQNVQSDLDLIIALREARIEAGLSQQDVADRMGLRSQSTISELERIGGKDPRQSTLRRYAAAIGVVIQHQVVPAAEFDAVFNRATRDHFFADSEPGNLSSAVRSALGRCG